MNSHLRSQSGQTMVEYLLLLVCILAIGFGTIWQFNTAFRDYAKGYFGNYIACLLRSGELPSLGAAPTATTAQQNANSATSSGSGSSCNSEFKPFKLSDGRPSSVLGGSGGLKSNSGSAAGNNSASSSSGSGSGSGGSHSSGTDGYGSGSNGYNSRLTTPGGNSGHGKKSSVPLSQADRGGQDGYSLKMGKNDLETVSKGGNLYRSNYGYGSEYVEAQKASKATLSPTKVPTNEQDKKPHKGRYISAETHARDLASQEDTEDTYSFTNIFRWVVIICILILMLIFFGGQAARISKSLEKGD